ncbi:MAG TPA: alpha/beta fold hydrolase [Candidatus Limnocylindria bacterium]
MSVENVSFYSAGSRISAILRLPNVGAAPYPAVVQGPGWLGLQDAKFYRPYHDGLLAAGIAVFTFDYRGFGDSEGDASYLDPMAQVEDWRNAVTFLETQDAIDPSRIGVFGSGGTGGGNAVMVAGMDDRIRVAVAQNPVADGRDWMRRMRREYEWLEFLERLTADRRVRVTTGHGELLDPRNELMVATPEFKASKLKSDVNDRVPTQVQLASAEAIFAYRPIDVVAAIAPRALMLICTEGDAVTPEEHALGLYKRAAGPKRLVVQTGTTHYAAYEYYGGVVNPLIVEWFERYLVAGEVLVHEEAPDAEVIRLSRTTD